MSGPAFTVMGIVNVTPDSFSDGGAYFDRSAAIAHGRELIGDGAGILDVGGESTRPGAEPVAEAEELRRVVPVIEALAPPAAAAGVRVSVDTSKLAVARAALAAGASLINDVTAFRAAPELAGLAGESGAEVCLVHMRGEPRTMQANPVYADVVSEVKAFLAQRLAFVVAEGVAEERVVLDPGIGFGKTVAHNLELIARVGELCELGRPVLIGTSRKTFLGRLVAQTRGPGAAVGSGTAQPQGVGGPMGSGAAQTQGVGGPTGSGAAQTQGVGGPTGSGSGAAHGLQDRLAGTIATNVMALERGASIFRVHDVRAVHDALHIASATMAA